MIRHVSRLCTLVAAIFAAIAFPAGTAHADIVGFTSPSGNIGCMMLDSQSVRCDIRDRAWSPPPKSADCDPMMDYGQGIVLAVGQAARFVCAGDTALGGGPPLAYGETVAQGSLECESTTSGMSCWDSVDGGSFEISRDGYQLS